MPTKYNVNSIAVGGITGLGTGVATFLATPSSANILAAVTGETGTGALVFADGPTLSTPALGVATATSIALGGGTALANYLQSTWTPVITLQGGAGNTVPVYTTNAGAYTRIGNMVFCTVEFSGDGGAEGAGTGVIRVSLPIAAVSGHPDITVPAGRYVNGAVSTMVLANIFSSGAGVDLYYENLITTVTGLTGADQNNTSRRIELSLQYRV